SVKIFLFENFDGRQNFLVRKIETLTQMNIATAIILSFETILLIAAVAFLLRRYANFRKSAWYVLTLTAIGWFLAFTPAILVLLSEEDFVPELWSAVFWVSFFLSWVLCPFFSVFVVSGEFRLWRRIFSAVWKNALGIVLWVAPFAVAGLVMLIAGHWSMVELLHLSTAAGNLYSYLSVLAFLGTAAVELPRGLFRSVRDQSLVKLYYAYRRVQALSKSREELSNELDEAQSAISYFDERFPFLKLILEENSILLEPLSDSPGRSDADIPEDQWNEARLVQLREKLRDNRDSLEREKNRIADARERIRKYAGSGSDGSDGSAGEKPEPRWRRFAAVALLPALFLGYWATVFVPLPWLAVLPWIYLASDFIFKVATSITAMVAVGLCLHTIFHFRCFVGYQLFSNGLTSDDALVWFASYACRLAAPVTYWVWAIYGRLDLLAEIDGFSGVLAYIAPVVLIGWTIVTWLSGHSSRNCQEEPCDRESRISALPNITALVKRMTCGQCTCDTEPFNQEAVEGGWLLFSNGA
ncbi:MAG: LMBR1 domain-containing protein, partial [Sulfobacillus sp.]